MACLSKELIISVPWCILSWSHVSSWYLDNQLPLQCPLSQSTSVHSKSALIDSMFHWRGRWASPSRFPLDPRNAQLTVEERAALKANIQLLRDAIVLFTATGAARGVSGHTGAFFSFFWSNLFPGILIFFCRWSVWHSSWSLHTFGSFWALE